MKLSDDKADVVESVCKALLDERVEEAKALARTLYPFQPIPPKNRRLPRIARARGRTTATAKRRAPTPQMSLEIWRRDGFLCRYTGTRLVLPQALELLSLILPNEFPYDNPPHGAYIRTHIAMWELWPAIDHVLPIATSHDTVSANSVANLVTASALVNAQKSWATLDELGWALLPPEPLPNWDGLVSWYVSYLKQHNSWLGHASSGPRLKRWFNLLCTH